MATIYKEKRRNSDKRREKSRDAARCRRGKETEVFQDLIDILPLSTNVVDCLDKTSVMRLVFSYMQIRTLMGAQDVYPEFSGDHDYDKLYPKALDGVLMLLSSEGDIIYISENVAKHIGIPCIEMMGHSLFDFIHPCDQEELKDALHSKATAKSNGSQIQFFLRLKSTLTRRGRSVNLKSASHKVMKCSGHLLDPSKWVDTKAAIPATLGSVFALIASPIPHPSNVDVPLDGHTFLTRHNMDMTFTYCDDRIEELTGYSPGDLEGKSAFDYHHALDSAQIEKDYKTLFSKGQTMTGVYRFLAKNGGYIWLCTQSTVISNNRTQKPQCVVSVNYVLSGVEEPNAILANVQNIHSLTDKCFVSNCPDKMPRDKDKPVFTSAEDLTYLAPTAGDAYILLPEASAEVDGEFFDDFYDDMFTIGTNPYDDGNAPIGVTNNLLFSPTSEVVKSPVSIEMLDKMADRDTGIFVDDNKMSDDDAMDWEMRAPYAPLDVDDFLLELSDQSSTIETSPQPSIAQTSGDSWRTPPPVMAVPNPLQIDVNTCTSISPPQVSRLATSVFSPGVSTATTGKRCAPPWPLAQRSITRPAPNVGVCRPVVAPIAKPSPPPDVPARKTSFLQQTLLATPPRPSTTKPLPVYGQHREPPVGQKHCLPEDRAYVPPEKKMRTIGYVQGWPKDTVNAMPRLAQMLGHGPAATNQNAGIKERPSVLMSLLSSGQDFNSGYSVKDQVPRLTTKKQSQRLLPLITQNDIEANAPSSYNGLLRGNDLLRALEVYPPS
uniref:Hypoxia-inducible factor 1 n=1 Tax=Hemithiris psittacea TaxID=763142 RepID=A0AA96HCI7_9BILA|nr:hypoxia-inducible factor 1 [Hemithiris psittacea]